MKKAEIPEDEELRLNALQSLKILDTPPEERFDRIVRMARRMFDVPVAFISFIDIKRQWFKASVGIDFSEISRDHAICGHSLLSDDVFIVGDAASDHRFVDAPLVAGDTNARFYASCPLKMPNGFRIGTLCVADDHPRLLDDEDLALLRDLAATVEREFAVSQSAITDDLTGIYNRRGFILAAEHSLNLCVRQDLPAMLAYLDLRNFRLINEEHGSAEGDRVLTEISRLLKSECRPSDIFARLGADEFASLFINAPKDSAEGIMARFHDSLHRHCNERGLAYDLTFAYGIVEYDFKRHRKIDQLLEDGAFAMLDTTHRKAS